MPPAPFGKKQTKQTATAAAQSSSHKTKRGEGRGRRRAAPPQPPGACVTHCPASAGGKHLDCSGTDLQPPIQRSLYRDTLAGVSSVCGYGRDQRIQLILFLLQLLHQALDGALGEGFALSALAVAHQAVNNAQTSIITCWRVSNRHIVHLSQLFPSGQASVLGAVTILKLTNKR